MFHAKSLPTLVFGGGLRGCFFGMNPSSSNYSPVAARVPGFDRGTDIRETLHCIHRQKACTTELANHIQIAHSLV